jgi:hypothetical protein
MSWSRADIKQVSRKRCGKKRANSKKGGFNMKRLLFFTFVLSVFFFHSGVYGSDWKKYLAIDNCGDGFEINLIRAGNLVEPSCYPYYDAESITYRSNGIVKVWVKFIPTGKDAISRLTGADSEVVNLLEINCSDRTVRALKKTGYLMSSLEEKEKGKSINFSTTEESSDFIEPGSPIEALYKIVCKKPHG